MVTYQQAVKKPNKNKSRIPLYIKLPLLFICSLILSAVIIDGILGFMLGEDYAPSINTTDKNLGKVYIPGKKAHQVSYCRIKEVQPDGLIRNHYNVRINSLGFRGPEPAPSDSSMFRVVCLGDSSTFGFGEDEENTYPSVIERRLSKIRPSKVYNLGNAGYTSHQGLMWFRELADKLHPDIVTISYGTNDGRDVNERSPFWPFPLLPDKEIFSTDFKPGAGFKFKYLRSKLITTVFEESAAISWISYRLITKKSNRKSTNKAGINRVSIEDYRSNLKKIIEESHSIGAKCVFVIVSRNELYNKAVEDFAGEHNIPVVDYRDLLKISRAELESNIEYRELLNKEEEILGVEILAKYPDMAFTNDHLHPNPLGHRYVGNLVADEILKMMSDKKTP